MWNEDEEASHGLVNDEPVDEGRWWLDDVDIHSVWDLGPTGDDTLLVAYSSPFGSRLQSIRRDRQLSQRQLAALLRRSHRTVNAWELGDMKPNLLDLDDLSRHLGRSIEDLVACDPTRRPRLLSSRAHGPANRERVGREIRRRRESAGLSPRDVHREAGVNPTRLAAIEAGADPPSTRSASSGRSSGISVSWCPMPSGGPSRHEVESAEVIRTLFGGCPK